VSTQDGAPSNRGRLVLVAVAIVVVGFVVFYWFAPQTLLTGREVSEELPPAQPAGDGGGTPAEGAAPGGDVTELASGAFQPIAHPGEGTARLLELADGSRIVRFEGFSTDNGPDLRIYLSTAEADGDPSAIDDDFVDLGPLKGNRGDQNYEIPEDVDVSRYRSVSVWCRRFSVGFTVAPLDA
jgi:hypothetical protein